MVDLVLFYLKLLPKSTNRAYFLEPYSILKIYQNLTPELISLLHFYTRTDEETEKIMEIYRQNY